MQNTIDLKWLAGEFPDITNPVAIKGGGQKSVFTCQHPVDGDVVLKLFHPGADENRAIREIDAAKKLEKNSVPKIFESGKAVSPLGEVLWVREQRIFGSSLQDVLAAGPLSEKEILKMGLQMLEAIAAAEAEVIVHRDVKPGNIIRGDDGQYRLIDFGLCRHNQLESLTATMFAFGVGTPGYASPEQIRNRKGDIDNRADLFGLGITLFVASEGYNPLSKGARDINEIIQRTETLPCPVIQRQIDADGEFAQLVQAMTRIQIDHRPRTALEALEWMREICQKEGVL